MKPGIYYNLMPDDYHAMNEAPPMLSASMAKLLCNETPLHAWTQHPRLNPAYQRTEKAHFDIGTIVHAMILEGKDKAVILDYDDRRTKKCREGIAAAREAHKIPILRDDYAEIIAMVDSLKGQLVLNRDTKDAFMAGKPEVTLIWEDEGVTWKARVDWLHDSLKKIDDFKSAANANPETLARTIDSDGLDIQEAVYRRGIQVLTGNDPSFRFIFQEKSAPYAACAVGLNPMWQTIGEKKRLFAQDLWKKCLETNSWPGYPAELCYPLMPKWAEDKWLWKETQDVV